MDVVHPRCAGVDISKRDAKVCVRIAGKGRSKAKSTVTTWGSVTNQVLALREHLIAEQAVAKCPASAPRSAEAEGVL